MRAWSDRGRLPGGHVDGRSDRQVGSGGANNESTIISVGLRAQTGAEARLTDSDGGAKASRQSSEPGGISSIEYGALKKIHRRLIKWPACVLSRLEDFAGGGDRALDDDTCYTHATH
jgi:hypothetical protein